LAAPYNGLMDGIDVVAFVFVTGAAMSIVLKTEAMHAAIGAMIRKLGKRKGAFLVVAILIMFAIPATLFGCAEEFIAFIPLLVVVAKALGYDRITGMCIVYIAVYASLGFPIIGPFSTLIAQGIAEVELMSGMLWRAIGCTGAMVIGIHHLMSYSTKVKKDPTKSLLYNKDAGAYTLDDKAATSEIDLEKLEFTKLHKIILAEVMCFIVLMAYGVFTYGWYFTEMAAVFFAMALVVGLTYYKGSFDKTINAFADGACEICSAAIMIAMSRMVIVILTQGGIIDTVVYALSIPLENMSGVVAAWGIYVSQLIVNIFVPSSSGQAVVVMPILTPLSDLIGVDRQVTVNAMVAADCFGNLVIPTHAITLACLGLAGIPWLTWVKFAWKLVVKWSIWTCAVLAFQVMATGGM